MKEIPCHVIATKSPPKRYEPKSQSFSNERRVRSGIGLNAPNTESSRYASVDCSYASCNCASDCFVRISLSDKHRGLRFFRSVRFDESDVHEAIDWSRSEMRLESESSEHAEESETERDDLLERVGPVEKKLKLYAV